MRQTHTVNIGDKFGRMLVLQETHRGRPTGQMYLCQCECGEQRIVPKHALYAGRTVSCGCYSKEASKRRLTKHGQAGSRRTPEYTCWASMLQRCHTPTDTGFSHYGARGIRVCDRWRNSFENFLADMGRKPSPNHSLDRIDNDGNYEKANCRWATSRQQANNTTRNRLVTFAGHTHTLQEWCDLLGITSHHVVRSRIHRGWSFVDAVCTPKMGSGRYEKTK